MQTEINKIYWPVVIFLIIQTMVSSELFWLLGLLVCIYEIVKRRGKIDLPFKEYKIFFVFLIWGTLIGLFGYLKGSIAIKDLVRDIFYFTNPIVFMYVGAKYAKHKIDIYRILNAFLLSCGIISFFALADMFQNLISLSSAFSVESWRTVVGKGGVIIGISIAIIFSGVIPSRNCLKKSILIPITALSSTYLLFSLSRTDMLIAIIMYICLVFQKENAKKVIKRILIGALLALVAIFILNSILPQTISSAFTEKFLKSFSEMSSSHSWTTVEEIQGNWRGYETYCAMNQWGNYNLIKQIFGAGFGERIYVGNYAYLFLKQVDAYGNPSSSISVLHNGYATQIIKLGVLGVIAYLFFYYKIIKKALKEKRKYDSIYSRLLLGVGLVLLFQTYFLNGLFKDYCYYPMIIIIGYTAYNIQRNKLLDVLEGKN